MEQQTEIKTSTESELDADKDTTEEEKPMETGELILNEVSDVGVSNKAT